ncbi:Six-hairpin glycosidase-like protein [Thelephora terrestris]|uniref:Trehalase n=1 Tax=Thelephora terrestris TaxID=56493 RepID=A0A9P6H941_9AGAM|nr:Six-hairpin glycosidase-like protein [Thelephora terrestris]
MASKIPSSASGSHRETYQTGSGVNLTEQQHSDLYAEPALNAFKQPLAGRNSTDQDPKLRTLKIRSTIPVDLNSLLYKSHQILAGYLDQAGSTSQAASHRDTTSNLCTDIVDLFWNPKNLAFYDYHLTSNARNGYYSPATFYSFWVGIIPPDVLKDQSKPFGASPPSICFVETGLRWNLPNAWPPHSYIALEALRSLPSNLIMNAVPNGKSFGPVPSGQLGITQDQLPFQPIRGTNSTSTREDVSKLNRTVVNGGTAVNGEGWGQTLQRESVNSGSILNVHPRRSNQDLNLTGSLNNTGNVTALTPPSSGLYLDVREVFKPRYRLCRERWRIHRSGWWTNGVVFTNGATQSGAVSVTFSVALAMARSAGWCCGEGEATYASELSSRRWKDTRLQEGGTGIARNSRCPPALLPPII